MNQLFPIFVKFIILKHYKRENVPQKPWKSKMCRSNLRKPTKEFPGFRCYWNGVVWFPWDVCNWWKCIIAGKNHLWLLTESLKTLLTLNAWKILRNIWRNLNTLIIVLLNYSRRLWIWFFRNTHLPRKNMWEPTKHPLLLKY